jgi:hypothetical protein
MTRAKGTTTAGTDAERQGRRWRSGRILAAVLGMCLGLVENGRAADDPHVAWATLRSLAGEWEGTYSDGTRAKVSYRLASNGTALIETLDTSDSDQMVSVYHVDGPTLLMTHYCSLGNQTRMRAKAVEGNRLRFEYVDVSNLARPDDHHMSGLVMTLPAPDRLVHEWSSRASGKEQVGRFTFVRRK